MNVKQEQPVKQEYVRERPANDDAQTELDVGGITEKVWLVKLPKFLFDKWNSAEPGTELGQLKINEANRREMKVVLNQALIQDVKMSDVGSETTASQSDIPQEYALEMQNHAVANTYIFGEPPARRWSDRPSRSNTPVESEGGSPDGSQAVGGTQSDVRRPGGGPDRSRKNLGGQRVSGKVVHECLIKPIDNQLYRNLLRDRVTAADVPKRRVQTFDDVALSGNLMAPGSIKDNTKGGVKSFILSRKADAKKTREINARMSLDLLLDEIVKCFKQYEYWSLKAFKAHLKQPESYLKETLENIATLHKRGPMTGKWQLKAETRNAMKGFSGLSPVSEQPETGTTSVDTDNEKIKSEHAGEAAPEDDDSDEDIEMEDRL